MARPLDRDRKTDDAWADAMHRPLTPEELHAAIVAALEITGGQRAKAARLVGISPATLRRVYGPKPGRWGSYTIPEPPEPGTP